LYEYFGNTLQKQYMNNKVLISRATLQPWSFRPKTGPLFPWWWKLDKWNNSSALTIV